MFSLARLQRVALAVMMVLCLAVAARADPIQFTFTSGTAGNSNYRNATVLVDVTSSGTVTFTVYNNLANNEVWSVGQNISGLYFTVAGGTGGSLTPTTTTGSFIEAPKGATPTGNIVTHIDTGWALAGDGAGNFALCVICSPTNPSAGPTSTIIGGSGFGDYIHANGSLDNNTAHNPFLVSGVVFQLHIDGVTSASQITGLTFQFGTTATPPTSVPDGSGLSLLLLSGFAASGMIVRRRL